MSMLIMLLASSPIERWIARAEASCVSCILFFWCAVSNEHMSIIQRIFTLATMASNALRQKGNGGPGNLTNMIASPPLIVHAPPVRTASHAATKFMARHLRGNQGDLFRSGVSQRYLAYSVVGNAALQVSSSLGMSMYLSGLTSWTVVSTRTWRTGTGTNAAARLRLIRYRKAPSF